MTGELLLILFVRKNHSVRKYCVLFTEIRRIVGDRDILAGSCQQGENTSVDKLLSILPRYVWSGICLTEVVHKLVLSPGFKKQQRVRHWRLASSNQLKAVFLQTISLTSKKLIPAFMLHFAANIKRSERKKLLITLPVTRK